MKFFVTYLAGGAFFLIVDIAWLTLVMSGLFKAELGQLLLERPKLVPAAIFYALFPIGLAVFAVLPALDVQSWLRAALFGALFGLLAYATYELTNLATLKGWSSTVAIADIAWGTLLSGAAATVGYVAVRFFAVDR